MPEATFYIDTASFSTATAVFSDASLTTKAADGYYSNQSIVRQQVNGILEPAETCTNCGSPTPTPTNYCITQNIDNQITGGTAGVDYDLSGDTPAPVVKCGPTGAAVSFTVTAAAKNNKRFKTSNPFRATNPSVVIGSSDATVTNVLTGELEDIVVQGSNTVFVFLGACFDPNASLFELSKSGDDGVYLEMTRSEFNSLSNGQRFAVSNPGIPGLVSNLFFNSSDSRNNPIKEDSSLVPRGYLANIGGRSFQVTKLPGQFDCPPQLKLVYMGVKSCHTATLTHWYKIDVDLLDTYLQSQRFLDGNGFLWTRTTTSFNPQTPLVQEPFNPVDITGIREGVPGFRGYTSGCPSTYYKIRQCGGTEISASYYPIEFYPSISGDPVGSLFTKSAQRYGCFEVIGTVDELEYKSLKKAMVVDADFYADGGCDNCQ